MKYLFFYSTIFCLILTCNQYKNCVLNQSNKQFNIINKENLCNSNIRQSIKKKDFVNTKWLCVISKKDSLYSYLIFKENKKIIHYDAENLDTTFGSYEACNDTLYLYEEYSRWDKAFPKNSPNKFIPTKIRMIFKKNELRVLDVYEKVSKNWVKLTNVDTSAVYYLSPHSSEDVK